MDQTSPAGEQPITAHLTVDPDAAMAYLRLCPDPIPAGGVARGLQVNAIIDLDADGNVLGIELLTWPAGTGDRAGG